jgi:hypothetical protein
VVISKDSSSVNFPPVRTALTREKWLGKMKEIMLAVLVVSNDLDIHRIFLLKHPVYFETFRLRVLKP